MQNLYSHALIEPFYITILFSKLHSYKQRGVSPVPLVIQRGIKQRNGRTGRDRPIFYYPVKTVRRERRLAAPRTRHTQRQSADGVVRLVATHANIFTSILWNYYGDYNYKDIFTFMQNASCSYSCSRNERNKKKMQVTRRRILLIFSQEYQLLTISKP